MTSAATMAEARTFTVSWRLAVAWLPVFLAPAGVLALVPADCPRWALMWLLAGSIYGGCKWLTLATSPANSRWRQIDYLFAWPGLDAPIFLNSSIRAPRPRPSEWILAAGNLVLGVVLLAGAARWMPPRFDLLRGWVAMAGVVFVLHFGLFQILSCMWRWGGVVAAPLMNFPVLATSVSDFWSRRWNTAFRDLTHRFLFRPLASRLGPRRSIAVGFLFSGLVHDLVISVPAGGGYGLPTAFFTFRPPPCCLNALRSGNAWG